MLGHRIHPLEGKWIASCCVLISDHPKVSLISHYVCQLLTPLCSPKISTEDGNIVIASPGDLVLQAGEQGSIQFQTATGEAINMTGPAGPPVRHFSQVACCYRQ